VRFGDSRKFRTRINSAGAISYLYEKTADNHVKDHLPGKTHQYTALIDFCPITFSGPF
jgi:hypothetical protein